MVGAIGALTLGALAVIQAAYIDSRLANLENMQNMLKSDSRSICSAVSQLRIPIIIFGYFT